MPTETQEIVLTLKSLRPPEIGGPRLKTFQPNSKSAPAFCGLSVLRMRKKLSTMLFSNVHSIDFHMDCMA